MKIFAQSKPLKATISNIAADKSISHRAVIFSLLSSGTNKIENFLFAEDTEHSLEIARKLGADIEIKEGIVFIDAPKKIVEPDCILECGNSGTSMRLFMGLLASVEGFFVLSGDEYLNERPMKRVGEPLCKVGAKIYGRLDGDKAPLCIQGGKLDFFKFKSKIASAQVKTALILAALNSKGCEYSEPELSRDHSEKMLKKMGADIEISGLNLKVKPLTKPLDPLEIFIPNDPSSAFYYAVAATIIPGSKIILKNMLLNKTRIEAYEVLRKMGASIKNAQKNGVKIDKIWNGSIVNANLALRNMDGEILSENLNENKNFNQSFNKEFDFVIANIITDVILILQNELKNSVKSGGILIISGILEKYKNKILNVFSDMSNLEILQNGEWVSFVFKKG